ncbi:GntR family transcriptional regulator [Timonella senegalensis]|uniref:GntR family transcriptional regulator n=1 Tax=Timonella senegalensis TaxID=1465825 RepID=UPI0002F04E5C|nr:GntR family transcriptional regulator [Timonella senegalensis]
MAKETLVSRVTQDLRGAITEGTYKPGDRLPTETDLARLFGVSRPTLRNALRQLEAKNLVRTQHGVGTFVTERNAIHAGLEKLESITESIRATGHRPSMEYQSRTIRPALPDEARKLGLNPNDSVLELRRSILADDEVVAYSYDLLPTNQFPSDFDPAGFEGSIFAHLEQAYGIHAHHSVAEIHAVNSDYVGWGKDMDKHTLFVLLDQIHYDDSDRIFAYSRTYFIEGKYAFSIHRTS